LYQKYVELREKKGVTDYRVATDTKISTATLSNWKAGNYTPKIDKLLILAEYFGVPVTHFLEDTEAPKVDEERNAG